MSVGDPEQARRFGESQGAPSKEGAEPLSAEDDPALRPLSNEDLDMLVVDYRSRRQIGSKRIVAALVELRALRQRYAIRTEKDEWNMRRAIAAAYEAEAAILETPRNFIHTRDLQTAEWLRQRAAAIRERGPA